MTDPLALYPFVRESALLVFVFVMVISGIYDLESVFLCLLFPQVFADVAEMRGGEPHEQREERSD